MGKAHEMSAHIVVRSPVRANRSPRRDAKRTRQCTALRSVARPQCSRGRRRPRPHRVARRVQRQSASGESSDAAAALALGGER